MRGGVVKRRVGSALTCVATVVVMTTCASSRSQSDSQATPTQPVSTPASTATKVSTTTASTTTNVSATIEPSTTSVSTPQEFVSNRYGFAVNVPKGWSRYDAEAKWGGKSISGPGSLQFTAVADPSGSRTLMAAAANVPTGMQLAEWQAAMVRGTPKVCSQSPSTETTTLGGEPAVAWTVKCSDGFDGIQLAAVHGDRGYVFYLASATANDDAQDRQIFEGFRQSFRFTN